MDELWYKEAIIYGVDVERFADSNGDGVGDLPGLVDKIDYLADLGITCLWMLPFYPSPNRDNGYDITEYLGVDPKFGTLDDFAALVRRAGERGMRILLDLVVNHTSDQHPWFQAARRDPRSRYRGYYVWSDSPPPTPEGKGPIFPGEEHSVWTFDDVAGAYYYHRFYRFQPELDHGNPDVRQEVERIIDFWLAMGVAGFRVDAAPHMIDLGKAHGRTERHHEILKGMHAAVKRGRGDGVLIGEVDVAPEAIAEYFAHGDELQLLFNFPLNNFMYLALARHEAEPLVRILRQMPGLGEAAQWANFARNLDELDLERLSDSERKEVIAAFGPKPEMQIYGRGLRRRLPPMLDGNQRRLELVYSLLFSLPGTPLLIYGEEIGMGEDLTQKGRNAVRAAMQWSDRRHGGFTNSRSAKLPVPVISEGPFSFRKVNVEQQLADPESLLNTLKRLIHIRLSHNAPARGRWHIIDTDDPHVLVHRCIWEQDTLLAMHNLTGSQRDVDVPIADQAGRFLVGLLHESGTQAIGQEPVTISLPPYGYCWFCIQGTRDGAESGRG